MLAALRSRDILCWPGKHHVANVKARPSAAVQYEAFNRVENYDFNLKHR